MKSLVHKMRWMLLSCLLTWAGERASGQVPPPPRPLPWTNSLGMVFRPVAGCQALVSVWETRVMDFKAFVDDSRYRVEEVDVFPRSGNRSARQKRNWLSPGFEQTAQHPVVLVSWEDAQAFCQWLTRRERSSGLIGSNQVYRLPTDQEWACAAGPGHYPWLPSARKTALSAESSTNKEDSRDERVHFPPPAKAGNYAGAELPPGVWPYVRLRNYADDAIYTAPAGQFAANLHGLHDLGGNVAEWCQDWFRQEMNTPEIVSKLPFHNNDGGGQTFRVVRGASWSDSHPGLLLTGCRSFDFPDHRADNLGFRVVLTQ